MLYVRQVHIVMLGDMKSLCVFLGVNFHLFVKSGSRLSYSNLKVARIAGLKKQKVSVYIDIYYLPTNDLYFIFWLKDLWEPLNLLV